MSSPSAPGTLILNSGSLIYMDPAAREQTGCAPDASLEACEPRIRSIMEDLRTTSSNKHIGSASSNGADGADAIRPVDASSENVGSDTLRASVEDRGDMKIVRLWDEAETQQTEMLCRDAAFAEIVRPIYRALAHDAHNPIVASQLQLGILREMDAEVLEERRTSLTDTLERHLEAMSTGVSLLIEELAPTPAAPPADVLAVIDRVRRIALPYAQSQSATVEARTGSAALYTSASEEDVKRTLLGYLARLLPHADPGNRIEIRVDRSASDTAPVVLLTAEGLVATDELARSTMKALKADAERCGARVENDSTEDNTTVCLILPEG